MAHDTAAGGCRFCRGRPGDHAGSNLCVALPSVRGHLDKRDAASSSGVQRGALGPAARGRPGALDHRRLDAVELSLIIPNMAAYYQYNCGVPRPHIGAYLRHRWRLPASSRCASSGASSTCTAASAVAVRDGRAAGGDGQRLLSTGCLLPAEAVVALFMVAQSGRNIAATTLSARVPKERERARYQSLPSAVQHIASTAVGAILGTLVLVEVPMTHRLLGIPPGGAVDAYGEYAPILVWLIQGRWTRGSAKGGGGIKNADSLPVSSPSPSPEAAERSCGCWEELRRASQIAVVVGIAAAIDIDAHGIKPCAVVVAQTQERRRLAGMLAHERDFLHGRVHALAKRRAQAGTLAWTLALSGAPPP